MEKDETFLFCIIGYFWFKIQSCEIVDEDLWVKLSEAMCRRAKDNQASEFACYITQFIAKQFRNAALRSIALS